MAFVRCTAGSDYHYFPEHEIVEMVVTASDEPEKASLMTKLYLADSDNTVREVFFYGEPVFV
jgi:hypothetical protein